MFESSPQIEVLQAGIQSTIQDLGRFGHRHLGICQAGALDVPALMLANTLLHNPVDAAGIEVSVGPFALRFRQTTWFALSGADFGGQLDGKPVAPGWRYQAHENQVLTLHGPRRECRAYLALEGGIDVPIILGARATDLQAHFGGMHGRALRKGDILSLFESGSLPTPSTKKIKSIGVQQRKWTPEIRAVVGPEFQQFSKKAQHDFWHHAWTVTNQSNRMGFRLQGNRLDRHSKQELFSHGVTPGMIQVPPNGQPIVLLADAQTTGGYPRIACVIEADLWKIAQTPIGKSFCFIRTELSTARELACQARRDLQLITQQLQRYA
ncbi:biotin-dependent carboxyltransferase family protein [Undibacterium cyanobacteriorum]|uniref:Biotin-dependent carboxyltransferase family protein n=1 Tax=Undibacterium cyanobacteriorum TaxID=3073561 RepID=A0ABY9RFI1_9BURK|nr:biotin-dependent carboxyltransferase family protein [Undibacterium sp. 20NA77.5]WMW79988.1 biotin-dependent carboxyltransferase family protein [Undibacterium sp. 20NA77.5]